MHPTPPSSGGAPNASRAKFAVESAVEFGSGYTHRARSRLRDRRKRAGIDHSSGWPKRFGGSSERSSVGASAHRLAKSAPLKRYRQWPDVPGPSPRSISIVRGAKFFLG